MYQDLREFFWHAACNTARMSMDRNHLVFIRFRPAWTYVDGVRDFCAFFCRSTFSNPEVAERVRVAIHEALENAVKYSVSEDEAVELSISSDGVRIEISLTNTPHPAQREELKREIEALRAMTPEEGFIAALQRAATLPLGSSKLGLARVRFEGGLELSIHEEAGDRMRVVASGAV